MAIGDPPGGQYVTPGEYGPSYLRYLSGVNMPQSEALFGNAGNLYQQAKPFVNPNWMEEAMAANAGLEQIPAKAYKVGAFRNLASVPGALKDLLTPGNAYGPAEFAADFPMVTAGAPALAGQVLANPIGHAIGGTPGDITEQAIRGAGFGSLMGTLGGPFAPITAPVGAGIGAVSNVAANAIFNLLPEGLQKKTQTAEPVVGDNQGNQFTYDQMISQDASTLNSLGLDPKTHKSVAAQYNKLKNADKNGSTDGLIAAHNYLTQQATGVGGTGMSPDKLLSLQALSTSLMAPYVEQQRAAANAMAKQVGAAFYSQDPNIQKINASLTNIETQGNNALAGAYMEQAQSGPVLAALASKQYNQGLTYEAQQGSGGSTSNILAALAGQAPATASNALSNAQTSIPDYNPALYPVS